MSKVIATIKLAEGQVGFYDPLSRIHLSISNPIAHVISGTNCAQLRRSVKSGRIRILEGTLGGDVPPFKVVKTGNKIKLVSNVAEEMKPVVAEPVAENKPVMPEVKEIKEEVKEAAPEPVIEQVVAEPVEELPKEAVEVEEAKPETSKKKSKKKSKKD